MVLRVISADGGTQHCGFAVVDHHPEDGYSRPVLVHGHYSNEPVDPVIKGIRVSIDEHRRRRNHALVFNGLIDEYQPHAAQCEGYRSFQREFMEKGEKKRKTVSSDGSAMIAGVMVGVAVARGLDTVEVMSGELKWLVYDLFREDATRRASRANNARVRGQHYRNATAKTPASLDKDDRIRIACSLVEGAYDLIWKGRPKGWRHIGDALTHALVYPRVVERNARDMRAIPGQLGLSGMG